MIFLIVFALIAIIVIALNIKDSANLNKIENYLKSQSCKSIIYSKGSYKAICSGKVVQIKNSFSVDIEKDKDSLSLNKVKKIDEKVLTIILNDSYKLDFKEKQNKEEFYKNLKENINK